MVQNTSEVTFTGSFHDVHKMNAYRAGHASLSVCVIQLDSRYTDSKEIWYGRHAIGNYSKTVIYNFLQSVIKKHGGRRGIDTSATCGTTIQ
jgi:hypothetical protein